MAQGLCILRHHGSAGDIDMVITMRTVYNSAIPAFHDGVHYHYSECFSHKINSEWDVG